MRRLRSGTIADPRNRYFAATLAYWFVRVSMAMAINLYDVSICVGHWHVRPQENDGKILSLPCPTAWNSMLRDKFAAGSPMECDLRGTSLFRAVDRLKGAIPLLGACGV